MKVEVLTRRLPAFVDISASDNELRLSASTTRCGRWDTPQWGPAQNERRIELGVTGTGWTGGPATPISTSNSAAGSPRNYTGFLQTGKKKTYKNNPRLFEQQITGAG